MCRCVSCHVFVKFLKSQWLSAQSVNVRLGLNRLMHSVEKGLNLV